MNTKIEIYSYTNKTISSIQNSLKKYLDNTWLKPHENSIFHICDELIKNAIKSNYKLILLLFELKKIYKNSLQDLEESGELLDWLKEILFSGENILINHNVKKIDSKKISEKLKRLMHYEKFYIEFKEKQNKDSRKLRKEVQIIYQIKKILKESKIFTKVEIYKNPEFIHIMIQNGSPILEEDFFRIIEKRKSFAQYVKENRKEEFFLEHLDTSGGGHGLGYPLIDALLLDMGLKPEEHLYLVSAKRTMVLLNLPLKKIP
ncbi:MAG: hypothetical protein ACK4UJ_10460 [Leptonema sp. (in: bacteria)]